MRTFLFWGILLLCSACYKPFDEIDLPYTTYEVLPKVNIHTVYFSHPDTGFVAGGDRFQKGFIWQTVDGGQHWTRFFEAPQSVRSLAFNPPAGVVAQTIGNEMYHWQTQDMQLYPVHTFGWFEWWDVQQRKNGDYLLVGGESFERGYLRVMRPDRTLDTTYFFEQELRDIAYNIQGDLFLAHYGGISYSENDGKHFERLAIDGDFFLQIQFLDSLNAYTVGRFGSIFKSSDGGYTWKNLLEGGQLFPRKARLKSIAFYDTQIGFVAGQNGLLWQTTDGGRQWKKVRLDTTVDLNRLWIAGRTLWIAGGKGLIFKLPIP